MIKDDRSLYTRKKQVKNYIKDRTEKSSEVNNEPRYINFSKSFTSKFMYKAKASEEEITRIFHDMGKYEIEDELNCGVCGYNTCLEKAQAIYEGMAETNMCLHYMRNKAESLTNIIFGNSPNLLVILDDNLKIKEINPGAEEIFMVKAKDVKDKPISILIEDSDFRKVKESKINIIDKKVAYPEYNVILNENILYLEKQNIILATMNNIMVEEKNKEEFAKVKENTLNAAQEVIEKQMRVAQEIASLLGETTAETKIILTKLKKIVLGEDGERR
jgi:PAS domain-containing protein